MIGRASAPKGFTIVELLIVIVVIGILAGITIISYNGVTNRANDVAVQSDLRNFAEIVGASTATSGITTYPSDGTGLSTLGLRPTKNSYGSNLVFSGQQYNLLYCSTIPSYSLPNFAFVASSKSGNVFAVTSSGAVKSYPRASWTASGAGWGTICPDILNLTTNVSASSPGVWLFENSIWKDYVSN